MKYRHFMPTYFNLNVFDRFKLYYSIFILGLTATFIVIILRYK